jgi:hypothetical protein
MSTAPVASKRSPLSIVMDVIVAPKSAFEAIAAQPRWLVAYLIVCALGMAGAILQIPVGEHVGLATIDHRAAHDPSMASMSAAQLDRVKSYTVIVQRFVWLMYPVIVIIAISIASVLLLVGNAIGRGQGTFGKYFAVAANVAIVNFGIYYLVLGTLCALHSPDSFQTQADVVRQLPSLAWLAPGAGAKLTVFLASINPFSIWSCVLLGLGLRTVGNVSAGVAYATAIVIAFGSVAIAVPFAQ